MKRVRKTDDANADYLRAALAQCDSTAQLEALENNAATRRMRDRLSSGLAEQLNTQFAIRHDELREKAAAELARAAEQAANVIAFKPDDPGPEAA